jgi:hypothetical protein
VPATSARELFLEVAVAVVVFASDTFRDAADVNPAPEADPFRELVIVASGSVSARSATLYTDPVRAVNFEYANLSRQQPRY